MITKITNNDLTKALSQDLAVLDFSAQWCGPCKMLAPVLEAESQDMPDVGFYGIDVDDNFALAQEYRVSSIPCLVVLKNGQEVGRTIGFQPQPSLHKFLEQYV